MPAIARANGVDSVFSQTGFGRGCRAPMIPRPRTGPATYTGVLVGGSPVVLEGDAVGSHPRVGCSPDTSTLDKFSSTVFINNKKVGRIGDEYTSDNIITSGFEKVFVGG